ncbi:MAG: peptidoglycan editing factor PgeF [Terriglobales bacterium]
MALALPPLLRVRNLSALPWLRHGFGTRACGLRHPQPHRIANHPPLLMLRQVHSGLVWQDPQPGQAGDGMFTRRRRVLLTIRTADCCPVLLVDARQRIAAAVHAGWRGTLARIAAAAVGEMRAACGSRPDDVLAGLGPCIRACCYQVGAEVQQAFAARFADAADWFQAAEPDPMHSRYPMLFLTGAPPGHPRDPRWNPHVPMRLDLQLALRAQLLKAGLKPDHIEIVPMCTGCEPQLFYSHRRGDRGRMLSAIGLGPDHLTA